MFICLPVELAAYCWAKLPHILMAENVYWICSTVAIHSPEFVLQVENDVVAVSCFRWVVTVVVYCVFIFIFVLTFAGLLKKSKWMLIL